MSSVFLHNGMPELLTLSKTGELLGITIGHGAEERINKIVKPFAYLKGWEKGGAVVVHRPVYLSGDVHDALSKPRPKNDKERIAALEQQLADLKKKLGEA